MQNKEIVLLAARCADEKKAENIKVVTLTDFDTVVETASQSGYIKENDKARLIKFRDNPSDESWIKKGGAD